MKIMHKIVLPYIFFLIAIVSSNAQTLTPEQQEYENNKVQIFTVNERNNLLNWFTDRAELMNLSESKEDEYTNILLFYFVKMARLDDKDQENSKEEILQKLDVLQKKQDVKIKAILSDEQYKIHQTNYGELIKSIKVRIEETDFTNK